MGGFKGIKRSASRVEDSSEEETMRQSTTKKTKTTANIGSGTDKEGNPYWELSNKRRVGVSKFKDMTMVNVREFYEKDGEMLPGKKGISLSLPQYEALLKAVPQINAHLQSLGHGVENSDDVASAPSLAEGTSKSAKQKKSKKANIEATSDEGEDD